MRQRIVRLSTVQVIRITLKAYTSICQKIKVIKRKPDLVTYGIFPPRFIGVKAYLQWGLAIKIKDEHVCIKYGWQFEKPQSYPTSRVWMISFYNQSQTDCRLEGISSVWMNNDIRMILLQNQRLCPLLKPAKFCVLTFIPHQRNKNLNGKQQSKYI